MASVEDVLAVVEVPDDPAWAEMPHALAEHDPVRYRMPYDHSIHDDVDLLSHVDLILIEAAKPVWVKALRVAKRAGACALSELHQCQQSWVNIKYGYLLKNDE
jgi:hypothetical protein